MNNFNPGDVVAHPRYGRGVVQDVGWVVFADDADSAVLTDVADDLRRLVTIDPEDREQVERLVNMYEVGFGRSLQDNMQAALREFAVARQDCR